MISSDNHNDGLSQTRRQADSDTHTDTRTHTDDGTTSTGIISTSNPKLIAIVSDSHLNTQSSSSRPSHRQQKPKRKSNAKHHEEEPQHLKAVVDHDGQEDSKPKTKAAAASAAKKAKAAASALKCKKQHQGKKGKVGTGRDEHNAADASSSKSKSKFPTSEAVYHRLRTDVQHFHASQCSLGYVDTFRGIIEVSLTQFKPIAKGGDVPWHRVALFKVAGQIVWDRANKICRLDEMAHGNTTSITTTSWSSSTSITRPSATAFSAQEAEPHLPLNVLPISSKFRVLTWNIMDEVTRPPIPHSHTRNKLVADKHRQDNERREHHRVAQQGEESGGNINDASDMSSASSSPASADSHQKQHDRVVLTAADVNAAAARRYLGILNFLMAANPDILCLQEVSDDFMAALDAHEQVTSMWPYRAMTSLTRQNILLLSRFTITSYTTLSLPHEATAKQILVADMRDPYLGNPVVLMGVHLTSARASGASSKRALQLALARNYLMSADADYGHAPAIILGDFNSHMVSGLEGARMEDAIAEEYYSFDPSRNIFAQHTSVSGMAQGMDKVVVRRPHEEDCSSDFVLIQPTGEWKMHTEALPMRSRGIDTSKDQSMDMTSTSSPGDLSDHYPVEVELEIIENDKACTKGATLAGMDLASDAMTRLDSCSALVLLPSAEQFAALNTIRHSLHDSRIKSWMPHVTLAHPFLPLDQLQELLDALMPCHDLSTGKTMPAFPIGAPFTATFDHVDHFQHEVKQTYFLSPDQETAHRLRAIYGRLRSKWPHVFDKPADEYHPHITLGIHSPSAEQAGSLDIGMGRPGLQFNIDCLYVVRKASIKKDSPFQVTHRIPLVPSCPSTVSLSSSSALSCVGGASPSIPYPSSIPDLPSCILSALSLQPDVAGVKWLVGGSRLFDVLARRNCAHNSISNHRYLLEEELRIEKEEDKHLTWPIGSSTEAFTLGDTYSDVDVLALLPVGCGMSAAEFLQCLQRHTLSIGSFTGVRLIPGRHESYLKAIWKMHTSIDVHVIRGEDIGAAARVDNEGATDIEHNNILLDVLSSSTAASVPSSAPVREPYSIWQLLATPLRQMLFVRSRKVIVRAARTSHVYGATAGYLPGIAWSVLVAAMIMRWADESDSLEEDIKLARINDEAILARFSQLYGTPDAFDQPITVLPTSPSDVGGLEPSSGVCASLPNASSPSSSASIQRTAPASSLMVSSGYCDKLMQILTCSDPVPRNIVRTLTHATKEVLMKEFATGFDGSTCTQPYGVVFTASVDFAHVDQLLECHEWMQEKIPTQLIKMARQVEDLRPFPLTQPVPLMINTEVASQSQSPSDALSEPPSIQLGFSWAIGHATNSSAVDLYCTRMIQQMRPLFPYVQLNLQHHSPLRYTMALNQLQ